MRCLAIIWLTRVFMHILRANVHGYPQYELANGNIFYAVPLNFIHDSFEEEIPIPFEVQNQGKNAYAVASGSYLNQEEYLNQGRNFVKYPNQMVIDYEEEYPIQYPNPGATLEQYQNQHDNSGQYENQVSPPGPVGGYQSQDYKQAEFQNLDPNAGQYQSQEAISPFFSMR